MIYNLIGDIHGRDSWKELVQDNVINIFVGDYFDPYVDYDDIPFEKCKENFLEIIEYKKQHPETILLIGNHDNAYLHHPGDNNRYVHEYREEICKIFEDNKDLFQIAYSIENKALVTHAGVSYVWYERFKYGNLSWTAWNCNYDDPDEMEDPFRNDGTMYKVEDPLKFSLTNTPEEAWTMLANKIYKRDDLYGEKFKKPSAGLFIEWRDKLWRYNEDIKKFEKFEITPNECVEFVNDLWFNKEKYSAFNYFRTPANDNGNDPRQGPMWIREEALRDSNIFEFTDFWQFFGHTQCFWWIEVLKEPKNLEIEDFELRMIDRKNRFVNCDCLSYGPISVLYDSNTDKITINKK